MNKKYKVLIYPDPYEVVVSAKNKTEARKKGWTRYSKKRKSKRDSVIMVDDWF